MTTTIEHVRHRVPVVVSSVWMENLLRTTLCGRRVMCLPVSTRDTRHHEPTTSRCPECWR